MIVSDRIAALVPGFDGLAPNESVTIPNVTPHFLQPGDDVMKFERRTLIRGTLGGEYDELIGIVQPAQVATRITFGFDAWVPSGAQPPYVEIVNIRAGNEFGAMNGALALGSPEIRASSAVYRNAFAGGRVTFFWGSLFTTAVRTVSKPSFLLINGGVGMTVYVVHSDSNRYDGAQGQVIILQPHEQRIVELPETGVARFSNIPFAAGFFAIDDVSWQ